MGNKKYRRYEPKSFESQQNSSDVSANIYVSMLMSDAWKALTDGAKVLYLYCKAQYYAEKKKPKPQSTNPTKLTEEQLNRCFTMNKSKWKDLYEITSNPNQFSKNMQMLIDYGFIELIENGKITRTKSIYMLSDKWRDIVII